MTVVKGYLTYPEDAWSYVADGKIRPLSVRDLGVVVRRLEAGRERRIEAGSLAAGPGCTLTWFGVDLINEYLVKWFDPVAEQACFYSTEDGRPASRQEDIYRVIPTWPATVVAWVPGAVFTPAPTQEDET